MSPRNHPLSVTHGVVLNTDEIYHEFSPSMLLLESFGLPFETIIEQMIGQWQHYQTDFGVRELDYLRSYPRQMILENLIDEYIHRNPHDMTRHAKDDQRDALVVIRALYIPLYRSTIQVLEAMDLEIEQVQSLHVVRWLNKDPVLKHSVLRGPVRRSHVLRRYAL